MSDKFAGGIKAGSTSVSVPVILRKTTDNTELTGITASGVTATYRRQGLASTAIVSSDLAAITSAWSAGGWKEADPTNRPGEYRLDVPDAAFATGTDWVTVAVKVAGAYVFFERYALESKGAVEVSNQIAAGVPLGGNDSLVTHAGTAQAGSTSTITLAGTASSSDSLYVGETIRLISGTGAGQVRAVKGYVGATKVATVDRAWTISPDNTSVYVVQAVQSPLLDVNLAVSVGTNSDKAGYALSGAGLDAVVIETGINARQALAPILAASAGTLSGATTSTVAIAAANSPTTNRITATVDGSGNRTAVSLNLPA